MENINIIWYRKLLKTIRETQYKWQFDLLEYYKDDYNKLINLWINEINLKLNLFFYIKESWIDIPFFKKSTKEYILKNFSYENYKHTISQINNTIYKFSEWKYWVIWKF